jgi:molybdopterin molybdotransferase
MSQSFTHFFDVKTRQEVEAILQTALSSAGEESLPLLEALNRIASETIFSPEPLPPFSRSTVDGYAVHSDDTFAASEGFSALLTLVGKITMGTITKTPLKKGEVMAISTGGVLPAGADAVAMVEHTEDRGENLIEIFRPLSPLENVVGAGEDVRQGEPILRKGQKIRPQELGLLAALGITHIQVAVKPVVGIISTGNEIVAPETRPLPGQVRDVNRYTLSGLIMKAGGTSRFIDLVPDNKTVLRQTCEKGLAQCNILLLSGGSSVGVRDLTLQVLQTFPGFSLLVHGVAISPGKPTILAKIDNKLVFGLPGHPASAWVIAHLFVTKAIHAFLGLSEGAFPVWDHATVSRNIPSAQGREDFIRARLTVKGTERTIEPIFSKSGIISSLVAANALIRIPLNAEGVYKGEEVDILLI